ncbi:hypothetical protein [Gracilibacillus dipsosauri]|jgi:hypothetical protein|uniref:hypothetical protein n=1 Tax=Gracilibacillus dipsosauri TaxID=178340 RepID=UPI00240A6101
MKIEVTKRFIDKDTKLFYTDSKEGRCVYESDDENRIAYLRSKGYLGEEIAKVTKEPSVLDGNVSEVQSKITDDLSTGKLNELLESERNNANRKGVIQHIESLLQED